MSRPMSKVPAILLGLIVLLLLVTGSMSSRLNRILKDNPAVAECLQAGGSAQQCRDASGAAASQTAPVAP